MTVWEGKNRVAGLRPGTGTGTGEGAETGKAGEERYKPYHPLFLYALSLFVKVPMYLTPPEDTDHST